MAINKKRITDIDVTLRKSFFTNRKGLDYVWWIYVDGEFKKEFDSDKVDQVRSYLIGLGKSNNEIKVMISDCERKYKEIMA